ncbi:benzoate transporter [Sesbania bispinosa]|nr:benzoate transporter [Sesbania bispinosa]
MKRRLTSSNHRRSLLSHQLRPPFATLSLSRTVRNNPPPRPLSRLSLSAPAPFTVTLSCSPLHHRAATATQLLPHSAWTTPSLSDHRVVALAAPLLRTTVCPRRPVPRVSLWPHRTRPPPWLQ